MPIQLRFLDVYNRDEFLSISPNDNEIAFEMISYNEEHQEIIESIILLTKPDVKHLIKELCLLVNTPDKIYT
jgi:hypothetical protein